MSKEIEEVILPRKKETVTFEKTDSDSLVEKKSQEDAGSDRDSDDQVENDVLYQGSEGRLDISESVTGKVGEFSQEAGNEDNYGDQLDELSDQELVELVADLEKDVSYMQIENTIFRDFMQNNDATLLDGFQALLDFAKGEAPPPPQLAADLPPRKTIKLDSASLSSMLDSRGPKINMSQKMDMVAKASEETLAKLDSFLDKSHKTRRKLKAELEEFSLRENDIKEAREVFEYNIVTQGVDKLTQRIPAEKFIRYMEDWLKSATFNIEKLRLRTASLKVHLKKVSQTLVQRQELGENVHAVDFDQLEIENKHFLEKIDQKNTHLLELKKMNGGANLVLSKHKKYLHKQQQEYNDLKAKIEEHQKLMSDIENECLSVEEEANRAKDRFNYITKLKNTYTVPEVMEYIQIKRELNEYRKNVKVWQRRKKIQDIALNACVRQMKNITGSSVVDPSWFEAPTLEEEDSDEDLFNF